MPRRAMFKGVISFADIRVPVKMYAAVESKEIRFHLLHDQDEVRLRQKMVCEKEDKPVPDEEIIKGLEVDDGKYILLTPEDLEEIQPETNRSIEVEGFTDFDSVDPRYYDRPYHLGPDGEEEKYMTLAQALQATGKMGVCHWSFRKRDYSGVLLSRSGDILELITLRTAGEVGAAGDLDLPEAKLSAKEKKTAGYLVDELTDEFDPSQYRNDFRDDLEDLIKTKAGGGKVKKRKAKKTEPTEAANLSDILEASLKEAKKQGKSKKQKAKS
ncbi:MAG: Ku protein [Phycisphaerae bacterium]